MNTYSQNKEDLFVLNYFGAHKGTLLSIGENDGQTLSNSLLLIENGWNGHLLEPGSICSKLYAVHSMNDKVKVHPFGIGEKSESAIFYESGCHVRNGKDLGLVSSTSYSETERWRKSGVAFTETEIELLSFSDFYEYVNKPTFDFISIDAEGYDWLILKQIDLNAIGCRCLCIEWNSDPELLKLFTDYCKGFKLAVKNAENLIFVK